ncbi:LPS-assembly protein LptD [Salicola sp. Rm-C-2C1-2]|uniref:LPS-assembly protein LptD n=1 Tax=Salicola sp. Rm-C-2C1-2 TaxID=3141321 RepID=UPI0032E5205D
MAIKRWRYNRAGRFRVLAASITLACMPVQAQESPSAAAIDWVEWGQLPPELQQKVPAYCGGAYRPPALEPSKAGDAASEGERSPVHITSRDARYRVDETLDLSGDVRVRQGELRARSDHARYDQNSGTLNLSGGVVSRANGVLLTGKEAEASDETGSLTLKTAHFLLHDAHMRGSAGRVERTGEEAMRIDQAVMTTCQPGRNDWSLAASAVDLDQASGFGTASHVRLRVKDVPVMYIPWLSFPIDDRRKSGFLYPSFGTSNTGSGLFVATPYYLNLAPHYDATYTPQYIHGRGYFSELETRYLSRFGQTDVQLGFIDEDSEYESENPRMDGKRWGLDVTSDADFGGGWRGDLAYAAVSDDDYGNDLNRTLDIQQNTHLSRNGRIRYSEPGLSFSAALRGYQTIDPAIPERSRPYNQLPRLQLDLNTSSGNWYATQETEYNYFWRENEDLQGDAAAVGHRLRTRPEVGWELRGLPGFVSTSMMLDHTQYQLDDIDKDERFSRSVPFADVDAGLYFDRFFDLGDSFYSQTLEPRLYYVYSPEREQGDIPVFDTRLNSFNFNQLFARDRFVGGDRVGDNNRLTTALTSRVYDVDAGIERARLSLGQIHRFENEKVTVKGRGAEADRTSPYAGELVLRPAETMDLRVTGQWDADERETVQGRSQFRFHTSDYRYLFNAGHTYDGATDLEQSDVSAVVALGEQTSVIGRWPYDMENRETAGTLLGLEYSSCCWNLQLVAQRYRTRDEGLDTRFLFQIQLLGLGGSGDAGETARDAIPGFDQRTAIRKRPTPEQLRRPAQQRWP